MDEWIAFGADFVDRLALGDPVFRDLQQQHRCMVPAFDRLMEALPEE